MIKKIVLWITLFFMWLVTTHGFLSSWDSFYYWDNKFTYYFEHNWATNWIFDSNDNLIDSISSNPYMWNLYYDWWLNKYHFKVYNWNTYQKYLVNSNWTFTFISDDWTNWRANYFNWVDVPNSTNPAMSSYYRVWYEQVVWNKPLHYNFDNWFTFYLENDTNWVDSLTFWADTTYDRFLNISWSLTSFIEFLNDWSYKYYIFDWIADLKYTSPSFTLPWWPTSCNDFIWDPMMYDECNMFWFTEFCNMDMYQVYASKPKLKYNWENKIVVENKYSSFSEENTYLQSINSVPNEDIEWFFTDSYVWNSDLQCRVFFKTDETVPNCTWKLIQNWNNLYCNPNLTHLWVTYNSPYFPYYTDETTSNYSCWAIFISTWTEWPPWPPWADWIDWTNWTDWADWTNGIDWTDWIDWSNWSDWFSCWDTNLNNINDLSEDKNNDWIFNTLDCYWSSWIDWANWLDWADWIDWSNWVDWQDWNNGTDWINWTDWANWTDWLNWETIESLSDDTKWFWDWIFDKIGWLFSIDESKVTDLQNSLSWAMDTWTNWFSIWDWWTSWINYVPWNKEYWPIINKNDENWTCDMFNWDWSFAYYSNWSYDLSIDLNNILDLWYADKVPFLEELLFIPNKILSFITNPLNNIFSTLRVFWWIWEKTYCYFGTLQTIQFQKHIMVWASFFWWEIIFTPWTLTIIDYLILFFMWIPMLILTVRILLY